MAGPEDDESKAKVEEDDFQEASERQGGAAKLPELQPVKTHESVQSETQAPDEFGLPVKPPRRRVHSVDQLESPELVKPPSGLAHAGKIVEESKGEEAKREVEQSKDDGGGSKTKEESRPSRTGTEAQSAPTSPRSPMSPPRSPGLSRKSMGDSADVHRHTAQKPSVGEYSHQQIAPKEEEDAKEEEEEEQWQEMPAYTEHRTFDDWGKVIAKGYDEMDEDTVAYGNLGGAGKGYTRVQMDEDAQSATSMDENTAYLFKDQYARNALDPEDDEARDLAMQMDTTKELLTEAQKFAYIGLVRLAINVMVREFDQYEKTKGAKRVVELAREALKMWGQKVMLGLYSHMEIDSQEQVMVEQLAEHGVVPSDLSPALMANARVKNPQAEQTSAAGSARVSDLGSARPSVNSARPNITAIEKSESKTSLDVPEPPRTPGSPVPSESEAQPPPAYQDHTADELHIEDPYELTDKSIDLDIRWTVLCDLFLLLIKDGQYDSRSRTLLERVGDSLSVPWQEISRFEKRVTDALEMQQEAEKENWNEDQHMKAREKAARRKRLVVMGLCTVGGGLVIGLSAGALAPVIGAGLAAGFTGIGVAGTGTFLGGTGAAALIGTTGTLIGGRIGLKGANRRTGAVKTFEYKPLYNNKRTNLIVTVAGWMTGKVDDVRLPFSTVNPVMGDIYSVNWEPEMLQSTGQTIQILGTEALTQTIQQILGATFLATLMAGLSLPIVLTKLAYIVDNPWSVSLARADATGLILADSLIDRNLGCRPVTLVGFSLGSRVIFSCLRELAKRGAVGLVQNVFIFGSPVVVKVDEWTRARSVVSGRFVNGYATNDWILAYLFRATSGGIMRIAGLATVNVAGIENVNVTHDVPGHMAYRGMMPTLLHDVGWMVDSVEFTEIEDPDPDNHEKRQRELILEIEEARREMDEKPEKKGWKSIFSRKKAAQKKGWETYDERQTHILEGQDAQESERVAAEQSNVMFDIDAVRREALSLAMEGGADLEEIKAHLSIREVESTLPALKIESLEAGPSLQVDGMNGVQKDRALNSMNGHLSSRRATNGTRDYDQYNEHDDGVTMTFDPESPVRTRPYLSSAKSTDGINKHEPASWDNLPSRLSRPDLRSVSTSPATGGNGGRVSAEEMGENPWDANGEGMEMSFE
ncbi:putative membrane protein [Teratosphaeria destructans]|uniref:Membrane protein n=1 Tax=Teratosphaeria destructans TaxID=418781 RepID=A0A9W7SJB6_9PEZI|nr:putative membrane protein [Teratosphaeria destructans]